MWPITLAYSTLNPNTNLIPTLKSRQNNAILDSRPIELPLHLFPDYVWSGVGYGK